MGCVGSDEKHQKQEKSIDRRDRDEGRINQPMHQDRRGQELELEVHEVSLKRTLKERDEKVGSAVGVQKENGRQLSVEGMVRRQSTSKRAIIQKYNIHVKDSSNKILSVNSYNYEALLLNNPTALQMK